MRDEGVNGMNVSEHLRGLTPGGLLARGALARGALARGSLVRRMCATAVFAVVATQGASEARAQCECAEYPLIEDVLPGDERTEVPLNTRVVFRFNRIAPNQTLLVALCDGENAPVAANVERARPPHRKSNHEVVVVTPSADLATNTKHRLKWMLEDEEAQGTNGAFELIDNCTRFDDATTVDKGTFTFTTGVTRDTVAPTLPDSIANRWLACVDYPDPSNACYSDCVRPYQEAIRMNVVPDNLTLSSELLYKVCVRESDGDAFACFFDLADVAAGSDGVLAQINVGEGQCDDYDFEASAWETFEYTVQIFDGSGNGSEVSEVKAAGEGNTEAPPRIEQEGCVVSGATSRAGYVAGWLMGAVLMGFAMARRAMRRSEGRQGNRTMRR